MPGNLVTFNSWSSPWVFRSSAPTNGALASRQLVLLVLRTVSYHDASDGISHMLFVMMGDRTGWVMYETVGLVAWEVNR